MNGTHSYRELEAWNITMPHFESNRAVYPNMNSSLTLWISFPWTQVSKLPMKMLSEHPCSGQWILTRCTFRKLFLSPKFSSPSFQERGKMQFSSFFFFTCGALKGDLALLLSRNKATYYVLDRWEKSTLQSVLCILQSPSYSIGWIPCICNPAARTK